MADLNSASRSRSATPPPPSYLSSLRNKASQFSLRTIYRDSYSQSSTPQRSRASTPSPSLLPTHDLLNGVAEDTTLRPAASPPNEHTRLFGLGRWGRKPAVSQQSYGAAIRLEDGDDDEEHEDLQSPAGASAFGLAIPTNAHGTSNVRKLKRWFARRPVLRAGLQMSGIFILSTLILGGTLWIALPTLEEADRPKLKIPKSFEQLQDLNTLLKKYKTIYPYRTLICFVIVYLFLQAFSLPGSMYLSILGGAVWGMARALPLCCACVATGATLCYEISAALGPALLTMPKWKTRIDKWSNKIEAQRANLLSFLIVLRISPLPPHWVVNIVAPHLGIGLIPFWVSTFFGIMGVTVIHTTIGGGLDEMTSAKDFKLISWKNGLGLSGIVVAVLIPVGIRYYFRSDIASIEEVEREEEDGTPDPTSGAGAAVGGGGVSGGGVDRRGRRHVVDVEDDDELEGVIVESGGPVRASSKKKKQRQRQHQRRGSSSPNSELTPTMMGNRTGALILLDNDDEDGDETTDDGCGGGDAITTAAMQGSLVDAPQPLRELAQPLLLSSRLEAERDELPPALPLMSKDSYVG